MEVEPTSMISHQNNKSDGGSSSSMDLLERCQAMVEIEQSLTSTLEKVEPWLISSTTTNINPNQPRVRPIPENMEQVKAILCVARNLASRTSAPAAWNPNAPVIGFSTPNPMPHQLRGGALATLQLDRARQEERDRKRKRVVQQEEQKEKSKTGHTTKEGHGHGKGEGTGAAPRGGDQQQHQQQHRAAADARRHARAADHGRRQSQQQQATMNLSESSSSEDEDSDSD